MELWQILLIIIGSIFLLFLIFCVFPSIIVTCLLIHPRRFSRKNSKEYNAKMNFNKGCEVLSRDEFSITLRDGYVLHGDKNIIKGSKKFVILCHGHCSNREGSLRYSLIFNELGFSTIIYDQRSHGDNKHKQITMGYLESQDLIEIINKTYKEYGDDIVLGLAGVSMGGATVLLSTKYQQKVNFIIDDCGYGSLKEVVRDMIKSYHLPPKLLLPFINLDLNILHHWSFKDAEPLSIIKENKIPVLFIHGQKDNFVKIYHAHNLYNAATCKKKLVIFDTAWHAASITVDRERYKKEVEDFLKEIGAL